MRDTLNDMQQYLVDEFVEEYQEGHISRREALQRIAAIAGSMVFATAILAACGVEQPAASATTQPAAAPTTAAAEPTTAPAAAAPTAAATAAGAATQPVPTNVVAEGIGVSEDDPAIRAEMVTFPSQGASVMAYLARPAAEGPAPIILVCHENRGLTGHIQDVTRRLAKAGYVGFAVDLLSRQGGTASVADVPGALGQTPPEQVVTDFQDGLSYLQGQIYVNKDQVGMVGFCYGGGVTWRVATKTPGLRAAVPFYGPPPAAADVPGINAAVLAMYGELDQRINQSIPEIEAAMQQNNKTYQKQIYPGANHAFHNDTGRNYKADAATDAWAKTLAWFEQYVKA